MSEKRQNTFTLGTLLIAAALFAALTVIINVAIRGVRADLTEGGIYSVSEGTENILLNIDEPINLYLYFSESAAAQIPPLEAYASRVREMLEEFESIAGGKINLEVIDPLPFSEQEDEAASYGLQGIPISAGGDPVYFGLVGTNALDDVETIVFFDSGKEAFLEYDLAKLVYSLDTPVKPVVGLLSELPVTRGFDPATRQMRQPWVIVEQLEQIFEVRSVEPTATSIDDEIKTLIVLHPKTLSEATLYAIDQFVMRGGNLVAFVDPHAEVDVPADQQMNPQQAMFSDRSSDLGRLFDTWGIAYDRGQVVLDSQYGVRVASRNRQPVRHIGILSIPAESMNSDDVTLANLSTINVGLAGHIRATPDSALTFEPLLTSSETSATVPVDRVKFLPDPGGLLNDFAATGEKYVIAARFQGAVTTAFPDGKPEGEEAEESVADVPIAQNDNANILVVADVDMLSDSLWASVQQIFGQRLLSPFANNGDFVVNTVDNLLGSSDLISVRGRATSRRPFEKIQQIALDADAKYRATEQQLESELGELERKLSELQAGRDDDNPLIFSAEQQAEIERFQQERIQIRKELRSVKANLRSDIESLETWLKFVNIAAVPLALGLVLLIMLFMRSSNRRQGV